MGKELKQLSEDLLDISNSIMKSGKYKTDGQLSEIAREAFALHQDIDIYLTEQSSK